MRINTIFGDKIPKHIVKYEKVKMGAENGYYLYCLKDHHLPEFILKKIIIDTKFLDEDEWCKLELPVIICNNPHRYPKKGDYRFDQEMYLEPYPSNMVDYHSNLIETACVDWWWSSERKNMLKCLNALTESKSLRELNSKEVFELSKIVKMPVGRYNIMEEANIRRKYFKERCK